MVNKAYGDEVIRCRHLLDDVVERMSNRTTKRKNMDTYHEQHDVKDNDGIEMGKLISTSSPIEGNFENTGVAPKVGNEQVYSFVGGEDSSNEEMAEVGKQQQELPPQQFLLNSEEDNNLVSAGTTTTLSIC